MTDAIIFLDALSPREVDGVLSEWKQGEMDSGVPRVTPRVMSSIYTGENPAQNGMMAVSRFGAADATRPEKSTFIDQMLRESYSVVSLNMPFCVPFHAGNPQSLVHGTALGGSSHTVPGQMERLVDVAPPASDMIQDHPDRVYASVTDQTNALFSTFKELIRRYDPDVALLGYRSIDSYCHFQHTETRGGQTYREHLIEDVAHLTDRIHRQIDGDVLFFSDHGQTELTDVFRINRWLKEKGYLSYKVDYDFIDTFEAETGGESHPVDERVENQITFGRPGVSLDQEESQVICADPFDSSLTLLCDREDFDAEAFREDLLGTGMCRGVTYRWEAYDERADYYETMPDVIVDRAEGVFTSGNIHDSPIGMGYYRTGVHDRVACFGATRPLDVPDGTGQGGRITPEQMHDVITDFIGLDVTSSPVGADDFRQFTADELGLIRDEMEGVL